MLSYALLIDAGFLKPRIGTRENPASTEKVTAFVDKLKAVDELKEMRLHRIYYYDAPPLDKPVTQPMTGEKVDYSETDLAKRNRQMLLELPREPFYALRLGQCHWRGWKLKNGLIKKKVDKIEVTPADLAPNIQQKGVDMRIGLDIASLTLKHQVDVIVLVTGDSDFVPAMKFARKEGAQMYLVRLGSDVRPELVEHADLDLTFEY